MLLEIPNLSLVNLLALINKIIIVIKTVIVTMIIVVVMARLPNVPGSMFDV